MTLKQKTKTLLKQLLPPIIVDSVRRSRGTIVTSDFTLPEIDLCEIAQDFEQVTISFPASQIQRTRTMVLPLRDLLSISAICAVRQPQRLFEIGTYTGSTTLLMAMNTAASAELFTLDLRIDDMPESWLDVNGNSPFEAGILFRDTPFQSKIQQFLGRSDAFDFSSFKGTIDLVYIDADHSCEAVLRDSEIAFELVSPDGIIVWDDYRWLPEHSSVAGVTNALHQLSASHDIRQLTNTRLAVFLPSSRLERAKPPG